MLNFYGRDIYIYIYIYIYILYIYIYKYTYIWCCPVFFWFSLPNLIIPLRCWQCLSALPPPSESSRSVWQRHCQVTIGFPSKHHWSWMKCRDPMGSPIFGNQNILFIRKRTSYHIIPIIFTSLSHIDGFSNYLMAQKSSHYPWGCSWDRSYPNLSLWIWKFCYPQLNCKPLTTEKNCGWSK